MSEQRLITKSLLTKIADAIRSKLGTTSTYTPDEMATAIEEIETGTDVSDTTATASGVVDGAIFYTADGTRTEGTLEVPVLRALKPSNSLPQYIYKDYNYTATNDGYAIESMSTITPSNSSPASLYENEFLIPSEDGYAIKSYSSITPSNSSPISLSSGSFYTPSASGYAISSYTSLTPSTLSTLSSGSIYKMASTGYCISSYSSSSKSPSSSGTSFSAGWNYMNSSGWAYSSQPSSSNVSRGSFTGATSVTVTCGFQPSYVFWGSGFSSTSKVIMGVYWNGTSKTFSYTSASYSSNSTQRVKPTSTGFTITLASAWTSSTMYYIACQ